MVAKTPPKLKKMAPLHPNQLRETIQKVDQCMARLQELQNTVSGGINKNLSPRSTRGYLRTSVRCKQESLRMKNSAVRKSPVGKFQGSLGAVGEWKRMSLPAMLVGETVGEILQASKFARDIVATVEGKPKRIEYDDPKTPMGQRKNNRANSENTELRARRNREKQVVLQEIRMESDSPILRRARSRITFKASPNKRDTGKENLHVAVNRVSPKNKPWAKKTVLFPNPLFHPVPPASLQHKICKTRSPVVTRNQETPHKFQSLPTSHQHKSCKMRSPVITRTRETPHKFLIKTPPSNSKFQVKIKNPPLTLSPVNTRTREIPHKFLTKTPPSKSKFQVKIKSPALTLSPVITRTRETPHKFLIKTPPSKSKFQVKIKSPPVTLSPVISRTRETPHKFLIKTPPSKSKFQVKIKSPPVTLSPTRANISNKKPQKVSTASKLRRSLSPAKLASRFVSPLKNRLTTRTSGGFLSGLKQHPSYNSRRFSDWRA